MVPPVVDQSMVARAPVYEPAAPFMDGSASYAVVDHASLNHHNHQQYYQQQGHPLSTAYSYPYQQPQPQPLVHLTMAPAATGHPAAFSSINQHHGFAVEDDSAATTYLATKKMNTIASNSNNGGLFSSSSSLKTTKPPRQLGSPSGLVGCTDSDLHSQDVSRADILDGVSMVLEHFVALSATRAAAKPTAFDAPVGLSSTTSSIRARLEHLMLGGLCSDGCFVMALIYAERLLQRHDDFAITARNVDRLMLICVMVASKMLDDFYCRNVYYAIAGGLSNADLNRLELKLCFLLNFDLNVSPQEFAKYKRTLYREPKQAKAAAAAAVVAQQQQQQQQQQAVLNPGGLVTVDVPTWSYAAAAQSWPASSAAAWDPQPATSGWTPPSVTCYAQQQQQQQQHRVALMPHPVQRPPAMQVSVASASTLSGYWGPADELQHTYGHVQHQQQLQQQYALHQPYLQPSATSSSSSSLFAATPSPPHEHKTSPQPHFYQPQQPSQWWDGGLFAAAAAAAVAPQQQQQAAAPWLFDVTPSAMMPPVSTPSAKPTAVPAASSGVAPSAAYLMPAPCHVSVVQTAGDPLGCSQAWVGVSLPCSRSVWGTA